MNALMTELEILNLFIKTAEHLIETPSKSLSVLVIGAGISGLSSANVLSKVNSIKVDVIEARDRIGGRIYSIPMKDGTVIDMGAQWIHGIGKGLTGSDDEKGRWIGQWNPVYKIALEQGFQTTKTNNEGYKGIKELNFNEDGTTKTPPKLRLLYQQVEKFIDDGQYRKSKVDESFKQMLYKKFMPKNPTAQEEKYMKYVMTEMFCLSYGVEPENLSAKYANEDYFFAGSENVFHTVKEINYQGQRQIAIKIKNGNEFQADQVIVTVPLGVLKAGDINFVPELPKQKQQSIMKLGTALLDKIYLEFEEVFWDPNTDIINYCSDDWSYTLNCYKHHTGKPILCLFNSGNAFIRHSEMGDDEVVASAMKAVKTWYPQAPDQPKSYIRTNWLMEEFTKMSYTVIAPGCTPQDFEILFSSVGKGRVHFAGEHTHHEFMACTHTALISGVRAAERIIGSYVKACTTFAFYLMLLSVLPINLK